MKNIVKYIAVFLLVFSLTSCFQYKEVKLVAVEDIKLQNISIKGVDMAVAMKIKNPNNYNISIVGSDLTLLIKGKEMGSANIKEKVTLKKKSTEVYHFTIQSAITNLSSGALPVLMGLLTQSSVELQVQGNIKAKAKGISKKFPVDFKEHVKL